MKFSANRKLFSKNQKTTTDDLQHIEERRIKSKLNQMYQAMHQLKLEQKKFNKNSLVIDSLSETIQTIHAEIICVRMIHLEIEGLVKPASVEQLMQYCPTEKILANSKKLKIHIEEVYEKYQVLISIEQEGFLKTTFLKYLFPKIREVSNTEDLVEPFLVQIDDYKNFLQALGDLDAPGLDGEISRTFVLHAASMLPESYGFRDEDDIMQVARDVYETAQKNVFQISNKNINRLMQKLIQMEINYKLFQDQSVSQVLHIKDSSAYRYWHMWACERDIYDRKIRELTKKYTKILGDERVDAAIDPSRLLIDYVPRGHNVRWVMTSLAVHNLGKAEQNIDLGKVRFLEYFGSFVGEKTSPYYLMQDEKMKKLLLKVCSIDENDQRAMAAFNKIYYADGSRVD